LGIFCIYAQLASKETPMELLDIGNGEHADGNNIAEEKRVNDLIQALGLNETKPRQLLAALLLGLTFFFEKDGNLG
jgi:hypothetical protein